MSELIYKTYKFHLKSSSPDGTFEGIASTSSLDTDNEIVDNGAFTRTLNSSKGVFPILWQHNREKPAGWNQTATESDKGLQINAKLLMNSEQGRYAHDFVSTGLEVGGRPGLSIGFRVPKDGDYIKDGIRHFREVILMEVSIVTFPANTDAIITGSKGAVSFQDLPLAPEDRPWDASSARARLKEWAGGDKISWSKYKRGFLWFDSSASDQFGSYKLPIGDIINGKLVAVPRGIYAAAGGHGVSAADIPAADKVKIRSVINRYYKKLKKSPLKGEGGSMADFNFKAEDFASQLATNQSLSEHYDTRWQMDRALSEVIDNICKDEDMSLEDKKPSISKCLDQHCEAMKSWWGRYLDITSPDDEEDSSDEEMSSAIENMSKGRALSEKEGRAISRATLKVLGKCMGALKESMGHSELSKMAKEKSLGYLTDLSTGRYWNDVNRPNPVGGAKPNGPDGTANPVGGGKSPRELELEAKLSQARDQLSLAELEASVRDLSLKFRTQ